MSEITDAGFVKTRLDQRLADLETAVQGIFGSDIDLSPESPDGQLLGVFAEALADLDDLAEAVYNGRSPAGARGASLARLVRLNGLTKKAAQFSTATVTLGGSPGAVIPIGALVTSSIDPTVVFETTGANTIGGGGTIAAAMRATVSGPLRAPAGTLTIVTTVVSGWTSAVNGSDAAVGNDDESDPTLRLRREASVALPSQGIIDGLYAALVQDADVTRAKVYENPTDVPDANGLPRHSINVIVQGGDPVDIANSIWLKKSVGVTQVGAVSQTITDIQGITHTMRFDRPVDAPIWITIVTAATPVLGMDTKAAIADAIVAWGLANSDIGSDVIWSQLFVPINTIPGLNIINLYIGLAEFPTFQANIVMDFNAIATWDSSRIVFEGI
jgi:uncharacterized phage protein gp47/JayE